jgi:ABC-type glycerol-3-phosphate transport system permease component
MIPSWLVVVVVVVPASLLFVFMLVLMLLRHLRAERKLMHIEQMRAIESGQPLDKYNQAMLEAKQIHNVDRISFALAFGVPVAALSAATLATWIVDKNLGMVLAIWISTALSIIAAVVCAIILVLNSHRNPGDSAPKQNAPDLSDVNAM